MIIDGQIADGILFGAGVVMGGVEALLIVALVWKGWGVACDAIKKISKFTFGPRL